MVEKSYIGSYSVLVEKLPINYVKNNALFMYSLKEMYKI